ncbi:hypothetical protein UT300016_26300 [Clostridium senegalense]
MVIVDLPSLQLVFNRFPWFSITITNNSKNNPMPLLHLIVSTPFTLNLQMLNYLQQQQQQGLHLGFCLSTQQTGIHDIFCVAGLYGIYGIYGLTLLFIVLLLLPQQPEHNQNKNNNTNAFLDELSLQFLVFNNP